MIDFVLFYTFFFIGLFTFGGGYAMLPMIQSEVLSHGWASEEEIINFVAVSESTPGPFAVNISTFIGRVTGGVSGAIVATLGVILPSFIIILIISRFYETFKESRIVKGAMKGLRPAVIGLIASAFVSIGVSVIVKVSRPDQVVSALIFAVMSFLAFKKVHPIVIILLSALAGIIAKFFFLQ